MIISIISIYLFFRVSVWGGGAASVYFYEISIFFHLKNMILHIEFLFFFWKLSHLFNLKKNMNLTLGKDLCLLTGPNSPDFCYMFQQVAKI
jgi:hypothetical protein